MADFDIYSQIVEDTGTLAQGLEYFGYQLRINLDRIINMLGNDLKEYIPESLYDKFNKIFQETLGEYDILQENFGSYRDKQKQNITNQEIFCKDRIEDKTMELNFIQQKLFSYLKEIKNESKSRLSKINDNFYNIKKIHSTCNKEKSKDSKELKLIDTKQKISTLKNIERESVGKQDSLTIDVNINQNMLKKKSKNIVNNKNTYDKNSPYNMSPNIYENSQNKGVPKVTFGASDKENLSKLIGSFAKKKDSSHKISSKNLENKENNINTCNSKEMTNFLKTNESKKQSNIASSGRFQIFSMNNAKTSKPSSAKRTNHFQDEISIDFSEQKNSTQKICIPDFSMHSDQILPQNDCSDDYRMTSIDDRRSSHHVDEDDLMDARSLPISIKESSGVFNDILNSESKY